jgi:hypothetical protein
VTEKITYFASTFAIFAVIFFAVKYAIYFAAKKFGRFSQNCGKNVSGQKDGK